MIRPRIGISTSLNDGEQRLDRRYVEAIATAGGIPMIVPMTSDAAALQSFAELLDGLLLTGGPAVVDGLVGKIPVDISLTDPVRIEADKAITSAFLETRRPVLGICYGMQLLNAMHGGSIYADFEGQNPGALVHSQTRGGTDHVVQARPGSRLASILGTSPVSVNTRHIQALARVGGGLVASVSAEDGCIEGIEDDSGLILGVQFHPERMGQSMQPLFEAFVGTARAHRSRRGTGQGDTEQGDTGQGDTEQGGTG